MPDGLQNAAEYLPFGQFRIDGGSAVLQSIEFADVNMARPRVDADFGKISAIRNRVVFSHKGADPLKLA